MKNRKTVSPPLAILAISLLSGCSSFKETHYFRQPINANAANKTPESFNYFRLTITGEANFSSSRYTSGYFDEQAVQNYFSEFSSKLPSTPETTGPADPGKNLSPAPAPIEPMSGSNEGKALVLILSTNSDAITDQINSLANNQALLNSVSMMAQKDKYEGVAELQAKASAELIKQKNLKERIKTKLVALEKATNDEGRKAEFLAAINTIANQLGAPHLGNSTEAKAWLNDNRVTLSKE